MPLTLHVDAERWRDHQAGFLATAGGPAAVVPVIKGNGYGPGREVLAREAQLLGVPTVAVGTYEEAADVEDQTSADLLVLAPWRPWTSAATTDPRLLHTVTRLDDLRSLVAGGNRPRVVVEVLTSMRRHGIEPSDLAQVAPLLDGVVFEGWALHLPLSRVDAVAEAARLGALAQRVAPGPLWVSHVAPDALPRVGPDVRLRAGTQLWLGGRCMRWTGTVLDVHRVRRGQASGYRQRRAPRDASLLVVAGGTSNGVGLESPSSTVSLRRRAVALGIGALSAAGRARSPYLLGGHRLTFAEPPHMQCSLVWAPADAGVAIGDELDLAVRFTTTIPDVVVGL